MTRCKFPKCKKTASYGTKPGELLYCAPHGKEKGCKRTAFSPKCTYSECKANAYFNKKGLYPIFCGNHAEKGMVDVVSKLCIGILKDGEPCPVRASFSKGMYGKKEYCATHAGKTRHNVHGAVCQNPNCEVRPIFGLKIGKALSCRDHILDGYFDVLNRKCQVKGCKTQPSLGSPIDMKSVRCSRHKKDGDVIVRGKICVVKGCGITATYGTEEKKPLRCDNHKHPLTDRDVRNVKCLECPILASFGYAGYPPEYCLEHKNTRMVYQPRQQPKEEEKSCLYCDQVINYKEEFCSGCKKYIDLGTTVKTKKKETEVLNALKEEKHNFTYNRALGSSRKLPDFCIKVSEKRYIVIEVDEYQHKRTTYSCECEVTRMKQIYLDICEKELKETGKISGKISVVFIRYNPDTYKLPGEDGKIYKKSERLKYLQNYIKICVNKKRYSKGLKVVYLFYDYFVDKKPEFEKVDCSEL